MARPPLSPGTYGEIKVREIEPGVWLARCQYRGEDGRMSRPGCRSHKSGPDAKKRLRDKLKEWTEAAAAGEISPETTFAEMSEWWMAEIQREADKGVRSPETPRQYRGYLNNWILPALGELRCRELEGKVKRFDGVIQRVHDERTYDAAKSVRTVLSGVCGYAVRHGAMKLNPIRSAARLARAPGEAKEVVALTDEQRDQLLDRLGVYAGERDRDSKGRRLGVRVLVWRDLPELAEAMLATGVRIGEVLALSADEVIKEDGELAVVVNWHIVRVPKKGLQRLPGRKGGTPGLKLFVPSWSVPMFTRRKLASGPGGPLFPSASGSWLDPSNTQGRLKAAIEGTELAWVTPHVFRKTVSDQLDQAGLTQSEIANQLGNTVQVVEKHYRRKRPTNRKAADALEGLGRKRKEA